MKPYFLLSFFFLSVFFSINAQFVDRLNNKDEVFFYEINFVFTGIVRNQVDSVFALHYSFPGSNFKKIKNLLIEDSNRQWIVHASSMKTNDSIEILRTDREVTLIIRNYNKYDLPILMKTEDNNGKKHDLFLRKRSGSLQSGAQLKEEQKMIRQILSRN